MSRSISLVLLCLALAACAAAVRPPSSTAAGVMDAQRQILVTLRIAPPHFRPDLDYTGNYLAAPGRVARRRVAQALARRYHLVLLDDWPIPTLNLDCFVMRVDGARVDPTLLQQLSADPRVATVQPMHLFHTLADNDPLSALQPTTAVWHLAELHRQATGRHVTVAELDSGVELTHPDLQGQVGTARNFVDDGGYRAESHGTEVAGIIAARADNGLGIVGVAPGARLLALRACWQPPQPQLAGATCSSFTLAKALQFALQTNAQVFNLSLSGPGDPLLAQLLDAALARGITIVVAIDPDRDDGGFPASHPGVLAVTADPDGSRLAGALQAPGRDIPTTLPGGQWGFVSGASFATAQVSGLVAVLRELSPRLRPGQLRAALASRIALGSTAQRPALIDACAAAMRLSQRCACDCAVPAIASRGSHP
ncbi:S8 family serine peptidase [Rhodanobacter ginsengisoli]|uniref:S8 family serine peptidase n=1 Tax=Rhodanobacter ginsengisoli TaxID=418646 RepID=A0ABW0QL09_9GAMM